MNRVVSVHLITAVNLHSNLCYSTFAVGVIHPPILLTAEVYVRVNLLNMTLEVSHEADSTVDAI
jgi:hypothetical protein